MKYSFIGGIHKMLSPIAGPYKPNVLTYPVLQVLKK